MLRAPGGDPPPDGGGSWVAHHVDPSETTLMNPSGGRYNEFGFASLRRPEDSLSVFSLLVNANSKLKATPGRSEDPTPRHHAELTALIVNAIFHVPETHQEASPIPLASQQIFLADGGQHHMDLDNHEHDTVEDTSDPDVQFEGSDYDYGSEEVDEPGTINGLTFSEMDTVMNRVSDGRISDAERAEAAMLMLGMAGGKFPSFLRTVLSSRSDSVH
jgi:hypothetical protein